MGLPQEVLDMIEEDWGDGDGVTVKRGDAIFEGTDYPRTWDGFVGQERAKEELQVAAASARARGVAMDHILLASGIAGVGKTTLATLVAAEAGVGLVRTTGPLSVEDFQRLLMPMQDRDVLFVDEAHRLTAGNRTRADWLLPWMLERKLYTRRGAVDTPAVTLVAATTDAGTLPVTLLSRFMTTPEIVPYTSSEGAMIAKSLSYRMGVAVDETTWTDIAEAADCNPRVMRQILSKIRDLFFVYPDTHPNLDKALQWAGMSRDGLSRTARDILLLLLVAKDHTLAEASLKAKLGEPGPIKHDEDVLQQRMLMDVGSKGRVLTDAGVERARFEARTRR